MLGMSGEVRVEVMGKVMSVGECFVRQFTVSMSQNVQSYVYSSVPTDGFN